MIETFNYSEFGQVLHNTFYAYTASNTPDYRALVSDIGYTENHGLYIYENKYLDLAQFYLPEYFSENFTALISALEYVGTFNAYHFVIQSVSPNAIVDFQEPNPGHLQISISNLTDFFPWGVNNLNDVLAPPDTNTVPGDYYHLRDTIKDINITQMLKLLELIKPSGIYLEVILL